MAKVVVVTSGKGGVGKTTSTAALGAALAQSGETVAVVDFDVGLRNLDLVMGAERRVVFDLINVIQGTCQTFAGADPRQASRYIVAAAGFADPRQGCTHRRRRRQGYRAAAPEVRLGDLRQSGRHRARSDARYAACRRRGHRDQPGGFLGTRFRPHHRSARRQDRESREGRTGRETPIDYALRSRCVPAKGRC